MSRFKQARKEVLKDPEMLARRVAAWLVSLMTVSEGPFNICLSGGSTPKRLYEVLATSHAYDVPWSRMHWYFGDERFVAQDDEKSNFLMARRAMFDIAPVPRGNIHAVQTQSETPEIAATRYQSHLERHYGGNMLDKARPFFDVMLLGLGEDAHTASLFSGNKALDEKSRWVVSVPDGTPPARITLTYPMLDSSRHVAFLAAGEGKRVPLKRLAEGDNTAPAARIDPVGDLHLFLDEAAAIPELS